MYSKETLEKLKNREFRGFIAFQFDVVRLVKIGGSYAVMLPKTWIDFNAIQVEDENEEVTYWIKRDTTGEDIVIKQLSDSEFNDIITNTKRKV